MDKVQYARDTLKHFVAVIDAALQDIWAERMPQIIHHSIFQKSPKVNELGEELMQHIMEHNTRPAKRLRASLIYYGYKLLKGDNLTKQEEKKLLYACASIEFTHTGLLIHDDYQDQDSVRRGMPTTHKFFEQYHAVHCTAGNQEHFGASMAINCGDFCLNLGNQTLLRSGFDPDVLIPALDILLEGVGQTIFGQSFDILLEHSNAVDEQDIYDLHHGKTGIYTYLTPLLVGMTLGGLQECGQQELIQSYIMNYAIPCGIAFQLQDDVIGLFGDEEKTGKSAYSDIKEGKKTLLMLKALELCTGHEREIVLGLRGNPDITDSQADFVRRVVRSSGALEYSYQKAREYAQKAQDAIQHLRSHTVGLDGTCLDYLEGIAEYMAIRREA